MNRRIRSSCVRLFGLVALSLSALALSVPGGGAAVLISATAAARPAPADDAQIEKNEQKIYEQAHEELKENFTAAKEKFEDVHDRFRRFRVAMDNWRRAVTRRTQQKSIDEVNELLDSAKDDALKKSLEAILGEESVKVLEQFEDTFNVSASDYVDLTALVGGDPRKQYDWMYNLSAVDRDLRTKGVYDRLDWIQDKFETAGGYIDRVGQLTEFMAVFDPTGVDESTPGGRLRSVGKALGYAAELAENVPGIGHLISYYIEATEVFADALDRLDGKLKEARQGALSGQLRDHEGIQKAFTGLCPDPDFHALMFFEITDERPALSPGGDDSEQGVVGPRVWEHLEDKRIFLFHGEGRAALLSGQAFGTLYEGYAALRSAAPERNRRLVRPDEFVSVVLSAGTSGIDPTQRVSEFRSLYEVLCGPSSLQMRRVLVHAEEITDPYQGELGVDLTGGGRLTFPVISRRFSEFLGLCLYSPVFRQEMQRLVREYSDRMVVTLVLIPADEGRSIVDPVVRIDGSQMPLKTVSAGHELLLPRRSRFHLHVEADGFLPVSGEYSFGTGGTVRVILQTVTSGTGDDTSPTDPEAESPTGTNPAPAGTEVPISPENVRLTITGATESVPGTPVRLKAVPDGVNLRESRTAIVWYRDGKTESARGEFCVVDGPDSGAVTVTARLEQLSASGAPRVLAEAVHELRAAEVSPVKLDLSAGRDVITVGEPLTVFGNLTAPGIPWSRLRLEWSHGLGDEPSARFSSDVPGTFDISLSVFRRLDQGEVKVGEAATRVIVVGAKPVLPELVVQGRPFQVGIQPHPEIAARVREYSWTGAGVFDASTGRWDTWQDVSHPHVTMMLPIYRLTPHPEAPQDVRIGVELRDEERRRLYEAYATAPMKSVGLSGTAADIWEGGGEDRNFGLTRRDSKRAPREIDGNAVSTARVGGVFGLSLSTVSEETATPGALLKYVRKAAEEEKNQEIEAVSIPPFRGFLMRDRELRYRGGSWSFDSGYRDAGSQRGATAWLIHGSTLIRVRFYAAGTGRFDNSDEGWLCARTAAVFEEAETILQSLSFEPDGKFRHTAYDGPPLDGSEDEPPLEVTLQGPTEEIAPGATAEVKAVVTGGRPPYRYRWEGDHAGSGAEVRVPALRPGDHRIAITVTSADGQSESSVLTYRVAGASGRLTGLPSLVRYGQEYTVGVALPPGLEGTRVYWQASPNVSFTQVETTCRNTGAATTSETRVLVDRCPPDGAKLWAQLINDQGATIGEAEQVTVQVQQPDWDIALAPANPRIGDSVQIQVTPSWPLDAGLFEVRWDSPESDARQEETANAQTISVRLRDAAPLDLKAAVTVPYHGDVIGTVSETRETHVGTYEVVVSIVDSGPRPKVWKTGFGLTDVPRGSFLTDQRVLLQAQIPAYPQPQDVRWEWRPNDGTSLTNADARCPTATRNEPGTAELVVVATDADGIELGKASLSFQVIAQSVDVLPGVNEARSLKANSDSAGDASGAPDSGDPAMLEAKRLVPAAVAQAASGETDAALATVRKIRGLHSGVGVAAANEVAEALRQSADEARENWDFEQAERILSGIQQLVPGDPDVVGSLVRVRAESVRRRRIEEQRQRLSAALGRGDREQAEYLLAYIRERESDMPGTPRPETEELAARSDGLLAAYDAELTALFRDADAALADGEIEQARAKLSERLNQGGLRLRDRNRIHVMLAATEKTPDGSAAQVRPLQSPWSGVEAVDSVWELAGDGLTGRLQLTVTDEQVSGILDVGDGAEELRNPTYDPDTGRITFSRSADGITFEGIVNGTRMQGRFAEEPGADGSWAAFMNSASARGGSGEAVEPSWVHMPPAVVVPGTVQVPQTGSASGSDPAGTGVLAATDPPQLELPEGVTSRAWRAPFPLGRILFDGHDNAYVFSADQDEAQLIRVTPQGMTTIVFRGEPFAGTNFRSAVFDGDDLLVSIDGQPEGGNRHAGVLRVRPDGTWREVRLPTAFGDAGDLIAAPGGGWYLSESGYDQIFRLRSADRATDNETESMLLEEVIRSGERPQGMRELVQDPHTGELLILNHPGSWPLGGPSAIYGVLDGKVSLWLQAADDVIYHSIDATENSVLSDGVFLLDSTGRLTRNSWEGFSVVALQGLHGFTQFRFSPGGSFYAVGGENQDLLLRLSSAEGDAVSTAADTSTPGAHSPAMNPTPGGSGSRPSDTGKAGATTGRRLDSNPRLIGIWSVSAGAPEALRMGIESPVGAVITRVQNGSPAARAGLRSGDLVVSFGGMGVENYEDLEAATLSSPVGSRQPVTIVRGMQRLTMQMLIGAGDPQRIPVSAFTHPGSAYEMWLPSSWQIAAQLQRDATTNRIFRGAQSRDSNYLLYIYDDSQPAAAADASLNDFLRQTLPNYPGRQTGRLTLGGHPAAFVGAFGGTQQRRLVLYRLAVVISGQRYEIDAIAPPLKETTSLTETLVAILNSVRPVR